MEHNKQHQRFSGAPSGDAMSLIGNLIERALDGISRFVHTLNLRNDDAKAVDGTARRSEGGSLKPFLSYVNNGLYKIERARQVSAVTQQFGNAQRTIKLTQRAIKASPKHTRQMFQGYTGILRDARRRISALYEQIKLTQNHLRPYNPHALQSEVENLEARLRSLGDAPGRSELEMILDARRDLLGSVQTLDDKLSHLITQMRTLCTALEVNHIRVVAISSRALPDTDPQFVSARMQEASEQLQLLEESLRELDA